MLICSLQPRNFVAIDPYCEVLPTSPRLSSLDCFGEYTWPCVALFTFALSRSFVRSTSWLVVVFNVAVKQQDLQVLFEDVWILQGIKT